MSLKWYEKKSGIYIIKNIANGKVYVGKTRNLYRRKCQHLISLKYNRHTNDYLQNSYNKYGDSNFIFEVAEFCDVKNLGVKEYYWICFYDATNRDRGYNIEMLDENGNNIKSYESIEKLKKSIKKSNKYGKLKGSKNKTSKEVHQYDLLGAYLRSHESCHLAAEFLGNREFHSLIAKKAREECGAAYEFQWRYYKVESVGKCKSKEIITKVCKNNNLLLSIPIIGINLNTNEKVKYSSISEASKKLNICISNIARIVKGERKKSTKLNMTFKKLDYESDDTF